MWSEEPRLDLWGMFAMVENRIEWEHTTHGDIQDGAQPRTRDRIWADYEREDNKYISIYCANETSTSRSSFTPTPGIPPGGRGKEGVKI